MADAGSAAVLPAISNARPLTETSLENAIIVRAVPESSSCFTAAGALRSAMGKAIEAFETVDNSWRASMSFVRDNTDSASDMRLVLS